MMHMEWDLLSLWILYHSHAVKNEVEGLGRYDGSYDQYFPADIDVNPAGIPFVLIMGKNEGFAFSSFQL
jgi:1,4-alpha-glucan branching enzyme